MTGEIEKTPGELRTFGLTAAVGLAVAAALLLWRARSGWPVPAFLSGLTLLAALAAPRLLRPLEMAGRTLVRVLTAALTVIVLTLAFYAVLAPIGLCLRILGRRPLSTRPDRHLRSYWDRVSPDSEYSRPDKPY